MKLWHKVGIGVWVGLVTLWSLGGAVVWVRFHVEQAGTANVGGVQVGITRAQFLDTLIMQAFAPKQAPAGGEK